MPFTACPRLELGLTPRSSLAVNEALHERAQWGWPRALREWEHQRVERVESNLEWPKTVGVVHFAPTTTKVDADETARLFVHNIVRLHGPPETIVSDQGSQFNSAFSDNLLVCGAPKWLPYCYLLLVTRQCW